MISIYDALAFSFMDIVITVLCIVIMGFTKDVERLALLLQSSIADTERAKDDAKKARAYALRVVQAARIGAEAIAHSVPPAADDDDIQPAIDALAQDTAPWDVDQPKIKDMFEQEISFEEYAQRMYNETGEYPSDREITIDRTVM